MRLSFLNVSVAFKEFEHLKWQAIKLQCALIINRILSSIGVDANIAIFIFVDTVLAALQH